MRPSERLSLYEIPYELRPVSEKTQLIAFVVALSDNGVIGKDGDLPWHIPEDLKHFKRVTMGKPIIMGRKTFASIGKPLPGRTNIVLTTKKDFAADGVKVVHSFGEAVETAQREAPEEIMVIGGAQVYQEALHEADRLYLTYVHQEVEGDTYFPSFDRGEWRETERREAYSEKAQTTLSFVTLERAK